MPAKVLRPFDTPQTAYDRVAAFIRMGHKYQIDDLVQNSLELLRRIYSDDFDIYMGATKTSERMSPIGVVNLARLTGALDLLPVALMHCCELESGPVKGFQRGDGTVERPSEDDLELCFKAKDRLIEARVQIAHRFFETDEFDGVTSDCPKGYQSSCHIWVRDYENVLLLSVVSGLCTPEPFSSCTSTIETDMSNVCEACRKALMDQSLFLQREVFSRLPAIMGIAVDDWGKKRDALPVS